MKNDQFYKEFMTAFEPRFERAVDDIFTTSTDTSFDNSLIQTFKEPLMPYLQNGKRIRPFLIAVGADSLDEKVLDAGIAFELVHTFALVHDDLMDGATLRRNVPTIHTYFDKKGYSGQAGAVLLGDFVLVAANEYLIDHVPQLMPLFTKMQRFLCIGQFYEMIHWGTSITPEVSERIARFKSAQYSFTYPLQLGLQLAGKDLELLNTYSDATGLAFQIRDDWLDITEDPTSGKDAQLDSKNSVPNIVQNLYKKNTHDLSMTEQEVQQLLENYRNTAQRSLELAPLSNRQLASLTGLLTFSSTI